MATTILVAGATGKLGELIIDALLKKGAAVSALVRLTSDQEKISKLEQKGVKVLKTDMSEVSAITRACEGVSCIVSALQGLRDTIVDLQSLILDAAVAAGVPRFIPSDYASDFTRLTVGDNRNFDLRREFYEHINNSPVKATSIFNGAFAEVLTYNIPLLDFKRKSVGYWEDPDWKIDFTTISNTAAFTADAALDSTAPRDLRIAGFQASANEIAAVASEVLQSKFNLVRLGSIEDLSNYNKRERAAHPEGENEIYPNWQRSQYIQSMFSVQNETIDNNRYSEIEWTSLADLISRLKRE